uniref:PC3-like endoprotease variant B (Trinotate prediction) n=1 Tax=Henneguya salminicola TaxID=69463 RepID=A0A6G3MHC6_HENSL
MLDGSATDALEASSLSFKNDYIDIYINCWGPKDDGKTFGKPGPLAMRALKEGAEKGRKGKGSLFVWATGNGGLTDDDCNCDGYTTSIYTISIGCIGDHGLSAYYTEKCSSTIAVTFNGASHKEGKENKMVGCIPPYNSR